jgi:arginine/serine-rich splicing factor 4/5/6
MGTRVFVGGLTYRVRERDIEKFFRKYGRIKEVAMKNGFAFVVSNHYAMFILQKVLKNLKYSV